MYLEIAIVIVLTAINGLLSMSELAVVSSRPARLKVLVDQGNRGAAKALKLAEHPGRFLSAVQIGITLVGVLSGAFSGATLGARLTQWLAEQGLSKALSEGFGVGLVVVGITYLSLIIGELVPKQIALHNPERVASRVATMMVVIATVSSPLVWLLDASGKLILKLIGQKEESEGKVTEEEVKTIIAEAESAGVLESEEKDMIAGVMRLADRSARALMTPRRDVEILDLSDTPADMLAQIRATNWSRLPVKDGGQDEIVGLVLVKDLFDVLIEGQGKPQHDAIRAVVQPAPVVMDSSRALNVLKTLRESRLHMALVFDEYGHFEGVVTSGDVLAAITGVLPDETDDDPAFVARHDGSFLVSGWMQIDEFGDKLGVPVDREADYETLAGFILAELTHLPLIGEHFTKGNWRFEVMDLDGRRIDKVLVTRVE